MDHSKSIDKSSTYNSGSAGDCLAADLNSSGRSNVNSSIDNTALDETAHSVSYSDGHDRTSSTSTGETTEDDVSCVDGSHDGKADPWDGPSADATRNCFKNSTGTDSDGVGACVPISETDPVNVCKGSPIDCSLVKHAKNGPNTRKGEYKFRPKFSISHKFRHNRYTGNC
jgi:hypothetical protein